MLYALGNRDSLLHAQFNVMFPLLSLSALLYSLWLFPSLSTSLVYPSLPLNFQFFLQKYTQYIIRTRQRNFFKNKKGGSWWRRVFLSCLRNAEWIPRVVKSDGVKRKIGCMSDSTSSIYRILINDIHILNIMFYICTYNKYGYSTQTSSLFIFMHVFLVCSSLHMYCTLCPLLNLVFDWHVACQVDLPHWMSIWMSSFANWGSKILQKNWKKKKSSGKM